MATWNETVRFLKSNFKIQDERDGMLALNFGTFDKRSQIVFVRLASPGDSGEEWLTIESPFGSVDALSKSDIGAVFGLVSKMVCGGIATMGDMFTLRHSLPLANVDSNELLEPLKMIVGSADILEMAYSGKKKDQF